MGWQGYNGKANGKVRERGGGGKERKERDGQLLGRVVRRVKLLVEGRLADVEVELAFGDDPGLGDDVPDGDWEEERVMVVQ
jgi:hypothetical protein